MNVPPKSLALMTLFKLFVTMPIKKKIIPRHIFWKDPHQSNHIYVKKPKSEIKKFQLSSGLFKLPAQTWHLPGEKYV